MTTAEIYEAVIRCNADTLMAFAFRRAVGCPQPKQRGRTSARLNRYADAERLMGQRYGVRM